MQITSSALDKKIDQLGDELSKIEAKEKISRKFCAAVTENPDELRPDYDFVATQQKIDELHKEIIRLRHIRNLFNTTTQVGDTGYTIDQALVRMPLLRSELYKLDAMRKTEKKVRQGITGSVIDYLYTSYDPAEADELYKKYDAELKQLQTSLDLVNNTVLLTI